MRNTIGTIDGNEAGVSGSLSDDWEDLMSALETRAAVGAGALGAQPTCDISWPETGSVRVRKVVKRSNMRRTAKYPSVKRRRMIQCESDLERDAFRLFDACPLIGDYWEQPARIVTRADGELDRHVPDAYLRILRNGRRVFVEFKEEADPQTSEIRSRTESVRVALARKGFGYCVLTDAIIRVEPRLSNVGYLLRVGHCSVSALEAERVRRWLAASPQGRTWGELARQPDSARLRAQVCRLALQGRVWVPLAESWGSGTQLYAV